MKNGVLSAAALLAVFGLLLVGCDSGPDAGGGENGGDNGGSNLSGSITIEGSSTVEPISTKAGEEFNKDYPGVNVAVSGQGTGNGFKALSKKECDVSGASRPIKASERDACNEAGLRFYEIPVAYDGLSIVVNKANDFVDQLTVEQLKMIFREDMAVTMWNEVDPSWPEEEITIYAPGVASGTHDYFREVIGKKDDKNIRSDETITLSEDDKLLVTGVKGEEFSIGFFGFSYYKENEDDLKVVPIVDPNTGEAVTPTEATIESGEYAPFSRPLFIYVNAESYQRAEVAEFVDFYLENAAMIAEGARYVPLPAEIYAAARDRLDKDMSGTHYLDEEGEKRSGPVSDVYVEGNLISE
ncbi:MAG: PstS family phosphate ABC transporter substrate-binding protein [Planctomycetota bacterium]